ncbi:MAG: hypothetical protein COU35_04005 [Candidatus Magasanikbacteria bacterium CG10_big_fil_rev_8_21_14_0_10_47_10]|uniref:O-antigen ligase-related domain-containing protein n=1 Tax=Candidatus Magasanikbacteria bacterium CG10_big_fil_rev_8_21_14_0_10_47_10 TaxID=1974652 RepID=A0A2H0TPX0_9BACT|nr:MAG: hypothetical protein COU35_04005 [Candidatus Magasanikbacteria bacterium CG10_big_fil_rev_8_21_14_0_10_47_10]
MSSLFEKRLLQYNKVLIFLSVLMPLLTFPRSFIFPFVVPKIIFFRAVTILLASGYILLLAHNRSKYRLQWTPITIAVLVFLGSFALSSFFGVDWYRSLWDNHERMLGLFTLFHYGLYYLVLTTVYRAREDWNQFLWVFLAAGSVVMLLGAWQYFVNPEFLFNHGSVRVSATLGNAIYYSGYGLFLFYISIILFLQSSKKWIQGITAITGLLGLLGIFLGGTRGTLVGLLVSIFAAGFGYAFILKGHKKVKQLLAGILIASVVLGSLLIVFRHTQFVSSLPTIGRLVSTDVSSGTANTRIMAWEIAVEGWKEKPFLGYGPNNYIYVFNLLYRPEFLEQGYSETWFDNAHSAIFNTLAVQGIIGLLSYIALTLLPIVLLWRAVRRERIDTHTAVLFGAFLVGHFVHNAFVFENPTSYLYFFFVIAYVNARLVPVQAAQSSQQRHIGAGMLGTVMVVSLIFIWITDVNPLRANHATLFAMRDINQAADLRQAEQALSIPSPHIDDIHVDLAKASGNVVAGLIRLGQHETAQKVFEFGYAQAQEALRLHPQDIRIHILLTQLAQGGAIAFNNPELFARAEEYAQAAIPYSPRRQQLYYNLSGARMQQGKVDEALDAIQTAIDFDPIINEGWWRKIYIYGSSGQADLVRATYLEALDAGVTLTAQQISFIEERIGSLELGARSTNSKQAEDTLGE